MIYAFGIFAGFIFVCLRLDRIQIVKHNRRRSVEYGYCCTFWQPPFLQPAPTRIPSTLELSDTISAATGFALILSSSCCNVALIECFNFTRGESKGGLSSEDGFNGSGALYSITSFTLDLSTSGFSGSTGLTPLWADLLHPCHLNLFILETLCSKNWVNGSYQTVYHLDVEKFCKISAFFLAARPSFVSIMKEWGSWMMKAII